MQRYNANGDLGGALARKTEALRAAGRLGEAEESLKAYVRLSREMELSPSALSGIFSVAGNLRFAQREFVQSENYLRRSDQVLVSLAYDDLHPMRTDRAQSLITALEGQRRWADALAEFDRLDGLAKDDARLQNQVQFAYERGLTYLHTGRAARAVPLFAQHATKQLASYGVGHFFVAQAQGLQGVALWRSGSAEAKTQALPLLKTAVRDYMSVANADFMENIGFRKEVRELIFATYLEAVASTPGEDASAAMGPADWVRGGVVQEALADAAVRSAALDPALSDLVRHEQDAKNESLGLRKYLAGEGGGAATPLPDIASKIRSRIAELEGTRKRLQAQIKARFPDYERLVRPLPPAVADIRANLGSDEALLMLLPTEDAVYVWAVTANTAPAFARVAWPLAQLRTQVHSLRRTLDFAEMGGRLTPFNAGAANELYQRLLAPVQGALQGKKQLVVAAGDVLNQLPFGVLLTQPTRVADANAPWLIKQAAITQVPSISAWLSIKQFAKAASASEAFMGWGDPQFATTAASSPQPPLTAANTRQVVLTRAASVADLEKEDPRGALHYGAIPPLPETRDELLAIAATLQANPQRDLHLGALATRASVLQSNQSGILKNKRVLMFATHGLMAGDLPNLSQPALALAATGAEAQDPLGALLTLQDVLGLKLNADWVVLSACNTAAADGRAEEALSGLARGFFYAGSRSLLVTHWAVESESAKQLTTATFDHYTRNPTAPKADSLRHAMLQVMAQPQYAHPAYWAPYALVGNGGR